MAEAELAVGLVSAAVAAYGAYSQKQNADQANATAQDQLNTQKDAQKKTDDALAQQQAQNAAKQQQDAQWMAMRQQASKMAGVAVQTPAGLTQPQVGTQAGATSNLNAG